jgi:hypothetical protein
MFEPYKRFPDSIDGLHSFRLLVQACAGTVIGVLLAVAAARMLFPPDGPPTSMPLGLLPWNLHNVRLEPREKGFFLLCLLLGTSGAFLATWRVLPRSLAVWTIVTLSVPACNALICATLQGTLTPWISILLAVASAVAIGYSLRRRGRRLAIRVDPSRAIDANRVREVSIYAFLLLILTLVLIPSSFETVAAKIGQDGEKAMHVVSFLLGPALYFFGEGLLPGVDYFTQYGIGMGWLFSLILGHSVEQALTTYVILVIVATWLFYAHLLYLLRWLYQSWITASTVGFLSLILLFVTPIHFYASSSSVLRYPLLTVSAALLASWTASPTSAQRFLALAFAIAASTFLQTETGVYTALAASLAFLLVSPWRVASLWMLLKLGAASAVIFVLLCVAVFGPRAFRADFLFYLIEPLTIYGVAGFGAWPIEWTLRSWNWLYNLVAPGAALATLGLMGRVHGSTDDDAPRAAVLAFFAATGLLMSAKYVNMSIVGVWHMNALGFLVVLGWWGTAFVQHLHGDALLLPVVGLNLHWRVVAASAMIFAAAALALWADDPRNPELYAAQSWAQYPALAQWPFHDKSDCGNKRCFAHLPAASDVALIRDRTRPGEQVAIVSDLYDWTYLLSARRAPVMFFLPSAVIFTERQLQESLRRIAQAQYLFVPRGPDGAPQITHADLRREILPLLEEQFERDGEGERLTAWKRKAHAQQAVR